jgi:hypothetical protein
MSKEADEKKQQYLALRQAYTSKNCKTESDVEDFQTLLDLYADLTISIALDVLERKGIFLMERIKP